MRKVSAFVTIEYSLLLPVLFLLYTTLIYVGLYQYNQCLLQNDMYHVAMEGTPGGCQNKYFLAEEMQIEMRERGNRTYVKGEGKMHSPMYVWGIGPKYWTYDKELEVWKHTPTNVLRLYKEIIDDE